MLRARRLLPALLLVAAAAVVVARSGLVTPPARTSDPRRPPDTVRPQEGTTVPASSRPGPRLQVKFAEGSGIRLREGGFVGGPDEDMQALREVLARHGVWRLERLFQRPEEELAAEKAAIEARSGRAQADLNLYFRLVLVEGADPGACVADLERLGIVERAYLDPRAAPPP